MIEPANSTPTLNSLHALRAIAALCVAGIHIYTREALSADSILPNAMELTRVGTDLFFVASGAVLAFSTARRSHRADEAASFLYDRLTWIMPLYWFVTIAILGVWAQSSQTLMANLIGRPELWSTALLMPTGVNPALPVAWSLTHLIFFYLIFSLTILLPRRFEAKILMSWAAIVVALRVIGAGETSPPLIKLVAHTGALEFIAGIGIMRLALSGRKASSPVLLGAAIVWVGVSAVAAGPHPTINTFRDGDFRFMTLGLTAILLIAAAISYDFQKRRTPNKMLRFLGDSSFGIYLGHSMCIALAARLWAAFERPGPLDNAVAIFGMVAFSIAVGWALHQFVELPMRKLTAAAKPHVMAALPALRRRSEPAPGAVQ